MKRFTLICGLVMSVIVLLAGVVSLLWTPYPPQAVSAANRYQNPGPTHWLGTDALGMDTASRLMVGAQTTLMVGVLAVAIAAVVGVPFGVFIGLGHRGLGQVVARASDILYALPAVLLAILLAASIGASIWTATIAIGVATVPVFIRMSRAATITVMEQEYILAAELSGASRLAIARRHVLPNIAPMLGVQAAASFSMAILAEAGLSYLGLSAPATVPTWGGMLRDASVFVSPWQVLIPGLAIVWAVLAFNLLGDGMRDYLDPRLSEAR
ncbi:MAG: ABC transporter permease [Propionibacteriaceae bacterium]|jgi:peptide/nickel transport system permease protein|nr:ABC transporter permease [Propionibacteriaceae bacterium]